ncbi:hypothetical protein DFH09DRAFT_1123201 [Mycena vulgaris]|nr:hypothetical protein DFH09DRAFT_1123201 [Mycena vulgaris]
MTTLLSLPGELLVHISTILIADVGDDFLEPVILQLCSVCKALRELLVNSPTVWTRLRIRTFNDLNGVSLFIARSETCLLDLFVYFDVFDHIHPEFIQSYAVPRWRSLTVRGPDSKEIARFVQAISTIQTPELKDVKLIARDEAKCGPEHIPLLPGASDALGSLTMRGCVRCLAPFPHLTHLNIFRLFCSYEDFRDLIQGSPNLKTLILGDFLDHEPVARPRPLIEASSLQSLAVGFINAVIYHDSPPLLAYFSMPNLEYLEVLGPRADYGELSGKPFPALRTLCLRDMSFPTCDAIIFRSFTKITHLELNNVHGVELLAAPDEHGATPWPDLRTLTCTVPDEESYSWLENLLYGRPRLTLYVPKQRREDLLELGRDHDMRFSSSDEPSGLIRSEEFEFANWEEENSDPSDFSDEVDFFGDVHDYDLEDDFYDEVDDYFEDDDDGLEGVEGWF